jgi:hypothetical protein
LNRLTKHISLVLISSSLILHGCERPVAEGPRVRQEPIPGAGPKGEQLLAERMPDEEEKKKEEEQAAASAQASGTTGGHGATPYHGTHFVPVPIPGRIFGGGAGAGTSPGISTHPGASSSSSSGSSSHSSAGSSVRGGFGSSAHGGSS